MDMYLPQRKAGWEVLNLLRLLRRLGLLRLLHLFLGLGRLLRLGRLLHARRVLRLVRVHARRVGLLGRLLLLQRAHQRRSLVLPADQQLIESPTIILVELDDNFKILIVILLCVLFWNWY